MQISQLSRRFGGVVAVDGVDLEVRSGEILGLIGPNGAGKSTLFALLAGAIRPSSGAIRFDGREVTGWSADQAARAGVGRTFQVVRVFRSMTVLENVMVAAYLHNPTIREARAAAQAVLARLGLTQQSDQLATNLSVASKRRLEMARALATRPRLLLLDEVMSGLTPVEANAAAELVRQLNVDGLTVVLVEHVMEVVMPLSARIVVLDQGRKIAEGKPEEIAQDDAVIRAYLGTPLSRAAG